jgi:SPP1 gp7 family putative phage head morphogenesis protein
MCEVCENIVVNSGYDPTRTTVLRNNYVRESNRRFDYVAAEIRKAVDVEDVFGLRKPTVFQTPGKEAFYFMTMPEKVEEFMRWLDELIARGILEVRELPRSGESIYEAWHNKYLFDSYKRGVQRARDELIHAGYKVPTIEQTGGIAISMSTPFHIESIGMIYIRAYNELKGITNAMAQMISRVLAQGMADGDNPRLIARKLVSVINGSGMGDLGITDTLGRFIPAKRRAEIMARTEMTRAHHVANVQEYKNWAAEGFEVKAELITAGDSRVCPICSGLEGKIYKLEEIENLIPVHPQCRCVVVPLPLEPKK